MKRSLKEVVFLSFTAICVPLIAPGAEPVNSANLRYNFAPDTTNAYTLQIESQGEAGREMVEGIYVVSARSVTGNLTGLTFRGQLRQKPLPGVPMMPFRGPGFPMSLSSYTMRPQMEGMELIIDSAGNVVREVGDTPLPVPLGQIMASLIEKLPATESNAEGSEQEVYVSDDPFVQGPAAAFLNSPYGGFGYSYYPGRPGLGVLSATMKTKVSVAATTDGSVTLHKTLALDSRMLTGSEPRVSATGEGDMVFDRKVGLPKSIDLQCKTLAVTENISRRTTATIRWKMLEGAERDAAINPPPPTPASADTEMSADDIAKLTEKLKSEDVSARQEAARKLSSAKVSSPSTGLLSSMVGLVNDPDDSVRSSALTFLANYGTQDHVMLLVKALNTTDQNLRSTIVRGLGRLKDKRAADALADVLAMGPMEQLQYNNSRSTDAADALARIGPSAEPAVLGLLKERNNATRWQACGILKRIGTEKSLSTLKELALSPSKELSEAAGEACRAIESRDAK